MNMMSRRRVLRTMAFAASTLALGCVGHAAAQDRTFLLGRIGASLQGAAGNS